MDQILALWNWITTHKTEVAELWAAVVTIASIIIKLIPALPANSWLLPIVKFIGKYVALNKTVDEAQRPT